MPWEKATDGEGKEYWWNTETDETSWTTPEDVEETGGNDAVVNVSGPVRFTGDAETECRCDDFLCVQRPQVRELTSRDLPLDLSAAIRTHNCLHHRPQKQQAL